jgi:hypothetical protein
MSINNNPDWVTRGKSIRQLITELQSFEDQDLPVYISLDCGSARKSISLVVKHQQACVLMNCEEPSESALYRAIIKSQTEGRRAYYYDAGSGAIARVFRRWQPLL